MQLMWAGINTIIQVAKEGRVWVVSSPGPFRPVFGSNFTGSYRDSEPDGTHSMPANNGTTMSGDLDLWDGVPTRKLPESWPLP